MVEDPIEADARAPGTPGREAPVPPLLTARELVVLQLLVAGYTPASIAALLELEQHQVIEAAAGSAARMQAADWRAAAAGLIRRGVLSAP